MKSVLMLFSFLILFTQLLRGQGDSTGLIPLTDLKTGTYQNYEGGLYPNGSNLRPASHDSLGHVFSKMIIPVDIQGNIDTVNGKIVLLSIGMSNATQEFSYFKSVADADNSKNPKLVIVDGAQGGQTASAISNPSANFWDVVNQRLQAANVTARQVLVCWVKEADANPNQGFPGYAAILSDELKTISKIIKQKFPSCLIEYLSSRIYGGYATSKLNPEPYAYESGFSVKWLIEKQINGDTSLTCYGTNPESPWLAWGPYLWADGLKPRSDGLTWQIDDFVQSDRTHPSTSGRKKVADMLLNFLKTDETSRNWFFNNTITQISDKKNIPLKFILKQNYPNPFNPSTIINFTLLSPEHVALEIYDAAGKKVKELVNSNYETGDHSVKFDANNFASGIYIYSIKAGNFVQSKKMVLLR